MISKLSGIKAGLGPQHSTGQILLRMRKKIVFIFFYLNYK